MNRKEHNRTILFTLLGITFIATVILLAYSGRGTSAEENRNVKIVFIPKVIDENNDFWTSMLEGANMAASDNNIDLTIMGAEAESLYERQNELIEEAIGMQPNAIALAPCDYEKTLPYAKKIVDAGIKLVLLDSVVEENIAQCIVATDNVEGGIKMGEYAVPFLDENAKIGIVGHIKGTSTAIEREQGVRMGLGEYADKIVDIQYCNSNYALAYQVTTQMLEEHPDINMIFGLNEYSAVGAARAVKNLGLSDQIHMIGFDSSLEEVQLLEEGVFDAIVVQKALNMGYLGITTAYQAALNQEVPPNVDSGSTLITKDTLYTEENEKLLFRFREGQ